MTKTPPKAILKDHIQKARQELGILEESIKIKKHCHNLSQKTTTNSLSQSIEKKIVTFLIMETLINEDIIKVDNNQRFIKLIEKLKKVDKKIDESAVIDTIISDELNPECRSNTLHKLTNSVVGEVTNGNEEVNDVPNYIMEVKVEDIINHTINNTTLYQKGSINLEDKLNFL